MTSGLASDSDKFKITITLCRAQKNRDMGPHKNVIFQINPFLPEFFSNSSQNRMFHLWNCGLKWVNESLLQRPTSFYYYVEVRFTRRPERSTVRSKWFYFREIKAGGILATDILKERIINCHKEQTILGHQRKMLEPIWKYDTIIDSSSI